MEKFSHEHKEHHRDKSIKIELKNLDVNKAESEDAAFEDSKKGIYIALDGITRGPLPKGEEYPFPSPATWAAKEAAAAMGKVLTEAETMSESTMLEAARAANNALRELNESLGLWANNDYLINDLAGTVFSAMAVNRDNVTYAYLGDCRVAKIDTAGNLIWISPDDIAPIRKEFPSIKDVGEQERYLRVRRDFRNKPTAPHGSYGALTGEDSAIHYIKTGTLPYEKGETILVCSDGITWFLEHDPSFQQLLAQGTKKELTDYLKKHAKEQGHGDDKTVLLQRF